VGGGDHLASDPLSHRRAEILANDVQGEIDSRAEPGRGEHLALVDIEGGAVDVWHS